MYIYAEYNAFRKKEAKIISFAKLSRSAVSNANRGKRSALPGKTY